MTTEKLLLVAGMIYILGLATPMWLVKLLVKSEEDGCFLNLLLVVLTVPFGALLIAFMA